MAVQVVSGDLLELDVDVIVNAWNQNLIPWWLLLPQGVSGAIKKRGGYAPFRELAKAGFMKLGSSVVTGAGKLPYQHIIHVAGINLLWRASEFSIRESVRTSMTAFEALEGQSIGYPIIGAGSGGFSQERALEIMQDELSRLDPNAEVVIVRFERS